MKITPLGKLIMVLLGLTIIYFGVRNFGADIRKWATGGKEAAPAQTATNTRPVLGSIGDMAVNELTPLVVTNTATDSDVPTNRLTFSLDSAPGGMTITTNGVVAWSPTEAQGPSTNTITIAVSDNGTPPLSTTNSFTVIVREVNAAPVLAAIANRTHVAGALCWLTNSASDPDRPTNRLSFSLVNPPPGMNQPGM